MRVNRLGGRDFIVICPSSSIKVCVPYICGRYVAETVLVGLQDKCHIFLIVVCTIVCVFFITFTYL